MTLPRATRILTALLALPALAACAELLRSDGPPVAGGVLEQRAKWEAQRLDDYRFVVSRSCFCTEEATRPARVEVRNGRVARVTGVESGRELDPSLGFTIDQLFGWIAAAEAEGTYVTAAYHPRLGYPTGAVIGTLANDAGTAYSLGGLEPLR
ncbi:MAG TPA: DUF6174 domain-containing protein [Longimicrobiaceae bacterium]|nr:DUF6174 domain-containing protein [Longimicrobiaceae bacterium]